MGAGIRLSLGYIAIICMTQVTLEGVTATCTAPNPGAHTYHDWTASKTYQPGDRLSYSCDTDYVVTAGVTATCTAPSPGAHTYHNGTASKTYRAEDSLSYSCDTGYVVDTNTSVSICSESNGWMPEVITCELDAVSVVVAAAVAFVGLVIFCTLAILVIKRPCCRNQDSSKSNVVRRRRNPRFLDEYPGTNADGTKRVSLYDSIILDGEEFKRSFMIQQMMNLDPEEIRGETIMEVNEKEANGGLTLQREEAVGNGAENTAQEPDVKIAGGDARQMLNGNHSASALNGKTSATNGGGVQYTTFGGNDINSNFTLGNVNVGFDPE